ncbi:MAG: RidA family protein [Ignavibacteriae bacterium]|nr:RidA family protein [Ignavibacteriota bacterium]
MLLTLHPLAAQDSDRRSITTPNAPAAIGPYSQAVTAGTMIFVAGQLGLDPLTGAFVEGGIEAQTHRALENIKAILEADSSGMKDVVSCTVYLKDLEDFSKMNAVYARFFPAPAPARATIQVARLPKDGLVEISCIAVRQ